MIYDLKFMIFDLGPLFLAKLAVLGDDTSCQLPRPLASQ
jgi:hypothetical protein